MNSELIAASRPTLEQLVRIATVNLSPFRTPTRDVLARFTKWDEAMVLFEKYNLLGGHKWM